MKQFLAIFFLCFFLASCGDNFNENDYDKGYEDGYEGLSPKKNSDLYLEGYEDEFQNSMFATLNPFIREAMADGCNSFVLNVLVCPDGGVSARREAGGLRWLSSR